MKSLYKVPKQIGKHAVAVGVLALATTLSIGFTALASAGNNTKSSTPLAEQSVAIHVQKSSSLDPQKRFDLDARINKMRESAPKLSLPSSMFEPWWKTMFHDPDSEWLMRNFDIMSSNPDKSWTFPIGSGSYIPRIDIEAADQMVKLSAEVPGIDEKNLDVTITDDTVSIKGEKREEEVKAPGKSFQSVERHYGSFERTVALPCKVVSDKAEAKLKNGILTVMVPKAQEDKGEAKKLTIRHE